MHSSVWYSDCFKLAESSSAFTIVLRAGNLMSHPIDREEPSARRDLVDAAFAAPATYRWPSSPRANRVVPVNMRIPVNSQKVTEAFVCNNPPRIEN